MHTQKISETPLDFAEAIKEDIKSSKDDGVLKCVQCGMCTSTCPAARHSNYNPREIMETYGTVFIATHVIVHVLLETVFVKLIRLLNSSPYQKELHMSSYMII